jgi:dolichol kinase
MPALRAGGAGLLLVLFAGAWSLIGAALLAFPATTTVPVLVLPAAQVNIAGLLAAAVGAGTASVLGIEVAKQPATQTTAAQTERVLRDNPLLGAGVIVYGVVGTFVLVVYYFRSAEAPDAVAAFALGVLGWLAASFAAVYRAAKV